MTSPSLLSLERWMPVPDWPNYEVSSHGRVKSRPRPKTKGGIMATWLDRDGYPMVRLSNGERFKRFSVHVLVCTAFNGPRPRPDCEVAHWDGSRTNCDPGNLRWVTRKENAADKVRHDRSTRGSRHHGATITEDMARFIKKALRAGVRPSAIADNLAVSAKIVEHIKSGKTWAWVEVGHG